MAGLLVLTALAGAAASARPAALSMTPPLRSLMASRGRWIGSCAAARPLEKDPVYRSLLGGQFNMLTPENEMKFALIHPRPDAYSFAGADAIVAFARARGMQVRGHTLVWHNQLPAWVTRGNPSPRELAAILKNHIQTVVGHYKGKLYCWDVVNEAILGDGEPRRTPWSAIGPDYIARAFQWARAADPDVKLFYNDYGAESSPAKAAAIAQLVSNLKSRGLIDGVGLQLHLSAGRSYPGLGALLHRFASLGVEVHITELDVGTANPETPQQLQEQAALYGQVLEACLGEPACKAFVMWGFSDKYSWRAAASPDILNARNQPKPAYQTLQAILRGPAPSGD